MSAPAIVARAFDPAEARMLGALLVSHGIPASMVFAETLANNWSLMLACGGIAITVPPQQSLDAIAILAAIPEAPVPRRRWWVLLASFVLMLVSAAVPPLPLRLRAERARAAVTAR